MNYLRIPVILALIMLLSACSATTPVKEKEAKSPSAFDTTKLYGEWWKNGTVGNDEQWSRQKPTALRRFNSKISFQALNKFGTTVLHPTDRHYGVVGTFSVQGNIVSTEYRLSSNPAVESAARRNRLVQRRFVVIKINDNDMVVRPVPTTTETTADAIKKSQLMGSWRSVKKPIDDKGNVGYSLTPCTQPSSENPCELVLQANGVAQVRVNKSGTTTVQAGTWALKAHNRLDVHTNQTRKNTAILHLSPNRTGYNSRVNYSTLYW